MGKHIGFGYMGGKLSHLNWLLTLLPKTDTYVELFGGCAAVLLNRMPAPIEVYNDLNSELVIFFRILRDEGEELIRLLELTPFSREEFAIAAKWDSKRSDMETARCFFIKLLQARLCSATDNLTAGRWNFATTRKGGRRNGIRGGRAIGVSRHFNKIDILCDIKKRLKHIQIEHYPALKIIDLYDGPTTMFYIDPPYPHESRSKHNIYKYEMSENDHRELADRLKNIKGFAAVSGYDCDLMQELYTGWRIYKERVKGVSYSGYGSGSRQEVLWTNYNMDDVKGQTTLKLNTAAP